MSELGEVTAQCKVCGKPVKVVVEPSGDASMDALLLKVARNQTVHTECAEVKAGERRVADAAERLEMKAGEWEMLCDPFYIGSEAWLLTAEAAGKVSVKKVHRALSWTYGPKGLLLHGARSGTGKTTAAWVVCKREHFAGKAVAAMTHAEMSDQATLSASGQSKDAGRWAEVLRRCDLLFIDDLGKSRFVGAGGAGRAAEEFLFELIDNRIRNNRPTLFTCNMDAKQLKASMSAERSEPFVRRLREFFMTVNFDTEVKK